MTFKETEKLRNLVDQWLLYYEEDEKPQKKEAAQNLISFVDSLTNASYLVQDWKAITEARFYLSINK